MEKMWFYAQGAARQGPMPESEIKSLIAQGRLAATDLAWTEGMTDWTPISALPELQSSAQPSAPGAPPAAHPALPVSAEAHHGLPLGLLQWMGFVGVVNIISGVLSFLTCFGAVTGIFLIIAGAALMAARTALLPIHTIDPALLPFFNKLKSFMLMYGVVFIVGMVSWVLMLVFLMTAALSQAAGGMHH